MAEGPLAGARVIVAAGGRGGSGDGESTGIELTVTVGGADVGPSFLAFSPGSGLVVAIGNEAPGEAAGVGADVGDAARVGADVGEATWLGPAASGHGVADA